jgi:hypothetical protein
MGKALLAQDLPDGRVAQRAALGFEDPLDVIDRVILLAQGDDERPGGVGFGLELGTGPAWTEKLKGGMAKLAAENPKSPRRVAEAAGDLLRGEFLDKIGAQRFILALGSRLGLQKTPPPLADSLILSPFCNQSHATQLVNRIGPHYWHMMPERPILWERPEDARL